MAVIAAMTVLPALQRCLKKIDEAEAKAAVIWMIGEYGEVRATARRTCTSTCVLLPLSRSMVNHSYECFSLRCP